MRFSYAESMTDPSFYIPLAKAAEDAGWDGFIVPDGVFYPEVSDSTYPYTNTGGREFLDGKPFLDPVALIAAMGAVTERLRFTTFVLKLPIRHPVLTAKQVTSLAALTGNRFGLGVGTSPWPDDYEVLQIPWERRGARMDECIEIIRGLETGEYYEHHGEFYDFPSIKMTPAPTEPIPILIGGHSERMLRRAAERCDGWMHAGGRPEELGTYIARLDELRRAAGRENEPFEIHAISLDAYSPDGIERLEEQGVTDVIIGFRDSYQPGPDTQPLQEKIDLLRGFADGVIAATR